jgi:hypothetical protein
MNKLRTLFLSVLVTCLTMCAFAADCPNECEPDPLPDPCYHVMAKNAGAAITVTQTPESVWAYACCSSTSYSGLAAIQKLNALAAVGRSSGVSVSAVDPNDRVQTWDWARKGEVTPGMDTSDPDWCDCVEDPNPWETIPSEGLNHTVSGTVEFNKPGPYYITYYYKNNIPSNPCNYTHEEKEYEIAVSIIPDPNEVEVYGCNTPSLPISGSANVTICDNTGWSVLNIGSSKYTGDRSWSYDYNIDAIPGGPCGQAVGPIVEEFTVGTTVESSVSATFEGIGASLGIGFNTESSRSYEITCPGISCRYVRAYIYQKVACIEFSGLRTDYYLDNCTGFIDCAYGMTTSLKIYTSDINWYCCNSSNGMDWPPTGDCECDKD